MMYDAASFPWWQPQAGLVGTPPLRLLRQKQAGNSNLLLVYKYRCICFTDIILGKQDND